MAQNQRKEARRQKAMIESMNKVEKPILMSLLIALFWILVVIAIGVGFHYTPAANTFINSFQIGFGVGLVISVLWGLARFGVLEGPRLKYRNYRNGKIAKKLDTKQSMKIDLDDFRALNKKRSWIGIYVLFAVNLIGTIVTLVL